MNSKTSAVIGAGLGLALFLALGLLPALLYGGYAGVLLAGGIFGTPIHANILVNSLIIFMMVLGVVAVAGLAMVAGAFTASVVHVLVSGLKKTSHYGHEQAQD